METNTVITLLEIGAIKKLKAQYARSVDTKHWEDLRAHHVQNPEIEILSDTTAQGIWALEDQPLHLERTYLNIDGIDS